MTIIQEALLLALEKEIEVSEAALIKETEHTFSKGYERRKRQIIRNAVKHFEKNVYNPKNGGAIRLRGRTVLIAILISLLAAATVIAAVKPEIYYYIKEKITNWEIVFESSEPDTDNNMLDIIKPGVPYGFKVTEEYYEETYYLQIMQNAVGETIKYSQWLPDHVTTNIDAERGDTYKEIINETEVIISTDGKATSMVFSNNGYVFVVTGDCGEYTIKDLIRTVLK